MDQAGGHAFLRGHKLVHLSSSSTPPPTPTPPFTVDRRPTTRTTQGAGADEAHHRHATTSKNMSDDHRTGRLCANAARLVRRQLVRKSMRSRMSWLPQNMRASATRPHKAAPECTEEGLGAELFSTCPCRFRDFYAVTCKFGAARSHVRASMRRDRCFLGMARRHGACDGLVVGAGAHTHRHHANTGRQAFLGSQFVCLGGASFAFIRE